MNCFGRFKYWGWLALLPVVLAGCSNNSAILQPANVLGQVLAREIIRMAGATKQVAVITPDASWGPPSMTETAFQNALKQAGFVIVTTHAAALGDPMKSGTIGLKAADFLEVLEKNPNVGAIVSFAGTPLLNAADVAKLPAHYPLVLVVATANLGVTRGVPNNRELLTTLVEGNIIQLGIVDGAEEASSSAKGKNDATQELFARHFKILQPAKPGSP